MECFLQEVLEGKDSELLALETDNVLFTDEAAVKIGYQPGHTWVSHQKNT